MITSTIIPTVTYVISVRRLLNPAKIGPAKGQYNIKITSKGVVYNSLVGGYIKNEVLPKLPTGSTFQIFTDKHNQWGNQWVYIRCTQRCEILEKLGAKSPDQWSGARA